MRRLPIDANKSLMELVARSGANEYSVELVYLTTFYVPEQPMVLNVLDELVADDVGSDQQSAVLRDRRQQLTAVTLQSRN